MTPKEKAEELVQKYMMNTPVGFHIEDAKKCALITVDEILNQHKKITIFLPINGYKTVQDFNENLTNIHNQLDSYVLQNYGYWQQVKQEIINL